MKLDLGLIYLRLDSKDPGSHTPDQLYIICIVKFHLLIRTFKTCTCQPSIYLLTTTIYCRDAKIAALEKTSQETEKLIAEARSDKLRSMDEVHAAQKKVTDLESR